MDTGPTAGMLGYTGGQDGVSVADTSLPHDPFTPLLNSDANIRVEGPEALPVPTHNVSLQTTETTYSLMMHMSKALGVNCTFCHNTRSIASWPASTPQRVTAWYGIRMVRDLNTAYRELAPLWADDTSHEGFAWIDCHDHENSLVSLVRRDPRDGQLVAAVANFTPTPRTEYRIGVPVAGAWRERLNSDADIYGGSNMGNGGRVHATDEAHHGHPQSLSLTVPPLGFLLLQPDGTGAP